MYNKDLVREILRHISNRIKRQEPYIIVREGNLNVKIFSSKIHFVRSDGNYLEIFHDDGKTTVRQKIGEFLEIVPDPLEYVRLRRSYIVRIDKVEQKGKKEYRPEKDPHFEIFVEDNGKNKGENSDKRRLNKGELYRVQETRYKIHVPEKCSLVMIGTKPLHFESEEWR